MIQSADENKIAYFNKLSLGRNRKAAKPKTKNKQRYGALFMI